MNNKHEFFLCHNIELGRHISSEKLAVVISKNLTQSLIS